jgi:16S rRNA (adenine1518-N6/adenine1519-N6)-dimethyltransferase
MNITPSPKSTILGRGLKPKKSFGQNFMVDQKINETIKKAVFSFGEGLLVVEIGAGTGSLTRHLLQVAPLVHAIERDRDLIPILKEHFAEQLASGHLILHEADGARFDLAKVLHTPGVLVGNLPYHLTSSIVLLALRKRSLLKGAVFLVQKEVADRLVANPHSKDYGFLTVIVKLAFTIKKIAHVDRSTFWPVPNVDSALIAMATADDELSGVDLERLIIFVREIFQKRRKKISTIMNGKLTKDEFEQLGIDSDLRPENLLPAQFLQMFSYLSGKDLPNERTRGDIIT